MSTFNNSEYNNYDDLYTPNTSASGSDDDTYSDLRRQKMNKLVKENYEEKILSNPERISLSDSLGKSNMEVVYDSTNKCHFEIYDKSRNKIEIFIIQSGNKTFVKFNEDTIVDIMDLNQIKRINPHLMTVLVLFEDQCTVTISNCTLSIFSEAMIILHPYIKRHIQNRMQKDITDDIIDSYSEPTTLIQSPQYKPRYQPILQPKGQLVPPYIQRNIVVQRTSVGSANSTGNVGYLNTSRGVRSGDNDLDFTNINNKWNAAVKNEKDNCLGQGRTNFQNGLNRSKSTSRLNHKFELSSEINQLPQFQIAKVEKKPSSVWTMFKK